MAVRIPNSAVFSVLPSVLKKSWSETQHMSVFMRKFHASGSSGMSNQLKKLLSSKRKKRWYITPQPIPAPHSGFMKPAKTRRMEESLRVRTLSMVVFKAVSDLLSSHEVNADVPNYNVELTKVKFPVDSCVCHVYWKSSLSSERDAEIQQALDRCAPRIRYLMTSQQVLGNVPPLVFILDKQYAALKEVENLLRVADFGPSDETTSHGTQTEITGAAVENRRNVFGVDHDELWKQIEDYRQRPRDPGVPSTGTREQLAALAEMRKQKLVEKKKRKEKKQRDDDITPREFLLARQLQNEDADEEDGQAAELMDDGKR